MLNHKTSTSTECQKKKKSDNNKGHSEVKSIAEMQFK